MKLTKWIEDKTGKGFEEPGILLKGGANSILSVAKTEEGIRFMEECDAYFSETYSKEDALKLVDELREWIDTKLDKLIIRSLTYDDTLFLIKEYLKIVYGNGGMSSILDNLDDNTAIKSLAPGRRCEVSLGSIASIFIERTTGWDFTLEIIVSYTALSKGKTGEKSINQFYDFCNERGFKCEL